MSSLSSRRHFALAILIFGGSVSEAFACSEGTRIPQLVALMRPMPVESVRLRELLPPLPLEELTHAADLIVEGRIERASAHLTKDQCDVATNYSMAVNKVIAGTVPLSATPGPSQPITFIATGGAMEIDGVRVAMRDEQLPPFEIGQHIILFLRRAPSADEPPFRIVEEIEGAFAVEANGRVRRIRDGRNPGVSSVFEYDAFVQQIKRVGR